MGKSPGELSRPSAGVFGKCGTDLEQIWRSAAQIWKSVAQIWNRDLDESKRRQARRFGSKVDRNEISVPFGDRQLETQSFENTVYRNTVRNTVRNPYLKLENTVKKK